MQRSPGKRERSKKQPNVATKKTKTSRAARANSQRASPPRRTTQLSHGATGGIDSDRTRWPRAHRRWPVRTPCYVAVVPARITARQFQDSDGVADWREVGIGACAC